MGIISYISVYSKYKGGVVSMLFLFGAYNY